MLVFRPQLSTQDLEATMIEGRSDLWHVQLASGDLEVMTLDELDDAFQNGRIDESTMVLQGGDLKWSRLGDILGEEEEHVAAPPLVSDPLPAFAMPMATAPRQLIVPTTPFLVSPIEENDNATPSIRPFAVDVGPEFSAIGDDNFDPDLVALRPSKKKFVMIGLAAAIVLAVGGAGLSKVAGSGSIDAAATNANVSAVVAAGAQPASPSNAVDTSDTLPGSRLSADQKRALAGMDKKLEEQQKAKAEAAAEKAAKRYQGHTKFKGKSGLHGGTNSHDPLNGTLNEAKGKW